MMDDGASFPKCVIESEPTVPAEVVQAIRRVVAGLDLSDSGVFREPHRVFFRLLKNRGARACLDFLETIPADRAKTLFAKEDLLHAVGNVIFARLCDSERRKFFHFCDFVVVPRRNDFLVTIRALKCVTIGGYTCYHSPRCPTITIDGQDRIVAFSEHALERTCERIIPDWNNYALMGDAYAFFADCNYFEETRLHRDCLGFTFFNDCALQFFHPEILNVCSQFAIKVIGFDSYVLFKEHGIRWYYRVGYCPAVVSDGYLVAKTLLFPGYTATPEFGLILKHVPRREQDKKKALARALTAEYLRRTQDFSLIRLFHDRGVEQVVAMEGDVFAHPLAKSAGVRPRRLAIDIQRRRS
jgi:hypothetical protein